MNRTPPEALRTIARLKAALLATAVVALLAAAAAVLVYQRFSTLRPLVTVGDRVISKREYQAVLDEQAGRPVLTKLVFGELVRQAAARARVMPDAPEVAARVALLQSRDPRAAQALAAGRADAFRRDITTDLALDNLRTRGLSATDAEVARYYAAHPALFRRQGHAQFALIAAGSPADAQTAAQLLREGVDPAVIARHPGFHLVGRGYPLSVPASQQRPFLQTLEALKAGEVRVVSAGGQALAAKAVSMQPARVAPLSEVRGQVALMVKLEKAPSAPAELATLYKAQRPIFGVDRYEAYFSDVEKADTARAARRTAALP